MDDQFRGGDNLDLHAQLAHDAHGGAAVAAVEEVADMRRALGDAAEHDGAVRNGFVTGHRAATDERGAWLNRDVRHGWVSVEWLLLCIYGLGCKMS